ncbi:hypothetical protein GCM10009776_24700 [Microbacterium deminutum]|uniref:DUF6194 domain-containing protein n=2 Tax=Microbacterium deminutum TaxID=344164 RepID=A0ABN2R055_9MICO
MAQILDAARSLEGILVLVPDEDSGAPEIAWGDCFFYYAPDGQVPQNVQPFATLVTKDYPDDTRSQLDAEGRYRVNIHVGRAAFQELTGEDPRSFTWSDYAAEDVVMPHPVYGALGWVSVVVPADKTMATVLRLLQDAYDDARARADRRASGAQGGASSGGADAPDE